MTYAIRTALLTFTLTILLSQKLMAVGLGPFYSFDIGKGQFTGTRSNDGYTLKQDNMHYYAGLVIDSNVSKNSLFAYRCSMGYGFGEIETIKRDYSESPGVSKKTKKYNIYMLNLCHTFGFGIIRKKTTRFWLGPVVAHTFENDIDRDEYISLSFEFGFSIGVNIHLKRLVSLTIDTGMRFKYQFFDSVAAYHGFINVGLLFRINDNYRSL